MEDDPGDVLMTREAFEDYKVRNPLHVVNDGVEAMAFLRQEGEYADAPRPDLVLLDLNLPRMDGREVLQAIKSDPELASIPVVVLTTSEAEEDVLRSYSLHANAYVTKPVDFERFIDVVRQIDDFFVTVVRLPRADLEVRSRAVGRRRALDGPALEPVHAEEQGEQAHRHEQDREHHRGSHLPPPRLPLSAATKPLCPKYRYQTSGRLDHATRAT